MSCPETEARRKAYQDGIDARLYAAVRDPSVDLAYKKGGISGAMAAAMRLTGGWCEPSRVLWHIRLATEPHFTDPCPHAR